MNLQKISKKTKIAVGALVVLGIGVSYSTWHEKDAKAIQYKTALVQRGDIAKYVLSTGAVAPENKLNIQAPIAGRAEQVLVDQGSKVKKGQVLAWISSTERAALLDSARSEGAAELKKWEEIYRPTPVMAPIDGMIITRSIQPGQTFTTTDAILVMSDHLIVQAQIDETDIAQIQLKQEAAIELDAYPGQTIHGRVSKIAYDSKTTNNVTTYEVDVLPEAVPPYMRSGMTANVTFPTGSKTGTLVIPSDAVKTKEGRPYVLVPPPKGKDPAQREITLGISDGKRVEVLTGLNEGETIYEPEFKLTGAQNNSSPLSFGPPKKKSSHAGP